MKWNSTSAITDIAFLLLLGLMFVGIIFIAGDGANFGISAGILCVATALAIFTYFTSLTAGLVANIILIFGYVSYVIYMSLTRGTAVANYTYFWVIWTPLFSSCIAVFGQQTNKLHMSLNKLDAQIQELVTVDVNTRLKNLRAFDMEGFIYMRIATRYNMHLTLLIWELRYPRELEHILGKSRMVELVGRISEIISTSLRAEDAVYLLDDKPYLWGTLIFTNVTAHEIVMERVRKNIQALELMDAGKRRRLNFEMQVGIAEYTPDITSSLQLLEKAKKQMRFDV
jgi:GGDEF domain-containing protein